MSDEFACPFCDTTIAIGDAIDAGWTPDFWIDEEQASESPCCPECAAIHLHDPDMKGEPIIRPEHHVFLGNRFLGIPEDVAHLRAADAPK